jgi:hypothetical protein
VIVLFVSLCHNLLHSCASEHADYIVFTVLALDRVVKVAI